MSERRKDKKSKRTKRKRRKKMKKRGDKRGKVGGGQRWVQGVRGAWVLRRVGPHTDNAR